MFIHILILIFKFCFGMLTPYYIAHTDKKYLTILVNIYFICFIYIISCILIVKARDFLIPILYASYIIDIVYSPYIIIQLHIMDNLNNNLGDVLTIMSYFYFICLYSLSIRVVFKEADSLTREQYNALN